MSSILLLRIASLHKFCFVLECFHIRSCCSIFNDQPQLRSVRCDSLYIIPQNFLFVNTFFKSFFDFFQSFFADRSAVPCRSLSQPIYYTTSLPVCQYLFRNFFRFGRFVILYNFRCLKLCKMHNGILGIFSNTKSYLSGENNTKGKEVFLCL